MAWTRRDILVSGGGSSAAIILNGCETCSSRTYEDTVRVLRAPLPSEPSLRDFVRFATLAPNSHNTQP